MPPGDTDAAYTDVTTVLGVPAWALFGEFERAYQLIEAHHNHTGYALLWFYSFVSSVVLVNLLIAMSALPRFERRPICALNGIEPTRRPTRACRRDIGQRAATLYSRERFTGVHDNLPGPAPPEPDRHVRAAHNGGQRPLPVRAVAGRASVAPRSGGPQAEAKGI
eukprot:7032432-Prymnesium_polylepis.1